MTCSKWSHVLFLGNRKGSFEQSILEYFSEVRSNLKVHDLQKLEHGMGICLSEHIRHLSFSKIPHCRCVFYFYSLSALGHNVQETE